MHRKMENKRSQNNKGCFGQILWKYIEQLKYTAFAKGGFIRGTHPAVQPLTLLYTIFDTKGTPFIYLLLENDISFTYPVNAASL